MILTTRNCLIAYGLLNEVKSSIIQIKEVNKLNFNCLGCSLDKSMMSETVKLDLNL